MFGKLPLRHKAETSEVGSWPYMDLCLAELSKMWDGTHTCTHTQLLKQIFDRVYSGVGGLSGVSCLVLGL